MKWHQVDTTYRCAGAVVTTDPFSLTLHDDTGATLARTAIGRSYPAAPVAARTAAGWLVPATAPTISLHEETLTLAWAAPTALQLALRLGTDDGVEFTLHAPEATALALTLAAGPEEHFYGLGERFNRLDQRGAIVELWVKNGASGGDTYKPVPFYTSTAGYGLALDTTERVFCALAHPTVPDCATITSSGNTVSGVLLPGPAPATIIEKYTARIGRPPVPPAWVFLPWKSRDWRQETQETVLEDLHLQQEYDLPCGVKLIDATWETEGHSFRFDPVKYPDPAGMIRELRAGGLELVLWLSPAMTADCPEYDAAAAAGYLIRDQQGQPYRHRLGNEPGWEGTTVDFTNPAAAHWWQEQMRALLEVGVRGFKTDFGEQVPEDAIFHDGTTGATGHNRLPVLYNQTSWAVVREYDGILLARSAWAGSQQYPAIWAGDQSADFSPWAGLPTAIVAGQSAGWSGFPYWGSDVGGYFNAPDDEVFVRWTEFAALTPIMEAHGLGPREPWLFAPETLATYRRYAQLHARLQPYSLAAAQIAQETGLPLMRAMALAFPDEATVHDDWVQYQYLYGPDLLVAPVYSWGKQRQIYFPNGVWQDFFTGERHRGPCTKVLPAPLDALPLFVRAGAVLSLRRDHNTAYTEALELWLYPGDLASSALPDGTEIRFTPAGDNQATVAVSGPARDYIVRLPHRTLHSAHQDDQLLPVHDNAVQWYGAGTVTLAWTD